MKIKEGLGIAGILLMMAVMLGGFIVTGHKLQANSPKQPRAAILIATKDVLGPTVPHPSGNGSISPIIGKQVQWVEASANCPTIEPGAALGPSIALILENGFRLEYFASGQYFFTR